MTKSTPYKKFIDEVILKMFESGMLNNILQRWKIEEPDCSPLITTGKPLDFTKLISIFFIIILGVLLAIIMVLFENFQNNLFKKKSDDLFSEKDFVNQIIEEMVNLYDAMKMKQDRSGLLTKEYFQWYSEASDIFRNYKEF